MLEQRKLVWSIPPWPTDLLSEQKKDLLTIFFLMLNFFFIQIKSSVILMLKQPS